MKGLLTERNIVVVLFIMVLITFSFAQNETRKMEQLYNGGHVSVKKLTNPKFEAKTNVPITSKPSIVAD
jgi:hypothetical protein